MTTTAISTPSLYSYGVLSVVSGQHATLRTLQVRDIMTGSWTMSFRVRFRGRSSGGHFFTMDSDVLYLQLGDAASATVAPNNRVKAVFQKYTVVDSNCELEIGRWYQVTMTVEKLTSGANVALYIDGAPFGQPDGDGQPAPVFVAAYKNSGDDDHPVLGGSVDAEFMNVTFWRGVLGGTDIIQAAYQSPPATNLLGTWDFSTPTTTPDTKAYTLVNGAKLACVDSGLAVGGGVALPDPADGLSPGADLTKPFTIQAWLYSTPPVAPSDATSLLCVLGNGLREDAAAFALGVRYEASLDTFVLGAKLPGVKGILADTTVLPSATWHHVTLTWDGAQLTFYVDGAMSSAHLLTPGGGAPTSPRVCIGAMASTASASGYAAFFRGQIQALGVWERALTAEEVATFQAPSQEAEAGAVAFFDLATTEFVNAVTQRRLDFGGTTAVSATGVTNFRDSAARCEPGPNPPGARDDVNLAVLQSGELPDVGWDDRAPITSTRLAADAVAALEQEAEFFAKLVPAAQQPAMRALLRRNLRIGLRRLDATEGPPPGAVTSRIEGEQRVFHYHTAAGPVEVLRIDAREMSACQAARFNLFVTCVGTVLCVLGVGFSGKALSKALLATYEETALIAIKLAELGPKIRTADGVLTIFQVLLGTGSMGDMLRKCLTGVRWYELAFTVLSLMATILAMFASGGWYVAFVAAQIFLNIGLIAFAYDACVRECDC